MRDFSKAAVTLSPAEYSSWSDARSEMMVDVKRCVLCCTNHAASSRSHMVVLLCVRRPLKAQLQAELSAAPNDEAREEITQAFAAREKALEHDLDHKPLDLHMTIDLSYKYVALGLTSWVPASPMPCSFCTGTAPCTDLSALLFVVSQLSQQVGQAAEPPRPAQWPPRGPKLEKKTEQRAPGVKFGV